jgi:predicted dehydrogenase
MLGSEDVDAAVVVVPPDAYRDVVVACLEAGLPVFTEKPGAGSVAALSDIENASARTGLPVMVGYMKRFAPAYRRALEFVRSPEFGRVTSVHARFLMGAGFRTLREYVIDNPVHVLDLMRAFAGEVDDLHAKLLSLDDRRHAIAVSMRFGSGAVGTAQLCTTASWFQENESLEVVGVEHAVAVTNVDTMTYRPPRGETLVLRPNYTVPLPQTATGTTTGFVGELEHFRAVVTEHVPCESDAASARRTLEVAERVLVGVGAPNP